MNDFLSFASELAELSEQIILRFFKQEFLVKTKKDHTPVTEADTKAESLMRERIHAVYPHHGIKGEEFAPENEGAEYCWVLDPIDGTQSFIHGVPLFGTLIALLKQGKPLLGIINLPALKERFIGFEGKPTTLNGKEISVSSVKQIEQATLLCTDHLHIKTYQDESRFMKLANAVRLYRNWGDCYMYSLLAKGAIEIAIDPIVNFWDIQALIPIVRGAGGIITDYQGNPPEAGSSLIASTPALHSQVLHYLHEGSVKKLGEGGTF